MLVFFPILYQIRKCDKMTPKQVFTILPFAINVIRNLYIRMFYHKIVLVSFRSPFFIYGNFLLSTAFPTASKNRAFRCNLFLPTRFPKQKKDFHCNPYRIKNQKNRSVELRIDNLLFSVKPKQTLTRIRKNMYHCKSLFFMNLEDFMLSCPSKSILGIECLGCGTQRALLLLFQGKFSQAFQMYPPIYTWLIFLGILTASVINKKRSYSTLTKGFAIVHALVMVVAYGVKHQF